MATKNFSLVAAALLAVGQESKGNPIVEALVSEYVMGQFRIFEIGQTGKYAVSVYTNQGPGSSTSSQRLVASPSGDIKLYDLDGVERLLKRSTMPTAGAALFFRAPKQQAGGDAVAALKARYKGLVASLDSATAAFGKLDASRKAAVSMNWHSAAAGFVEATKYADLLAQQAVINEWLEIIKPKKGDFATKLTAAGVDPATVT